MLLLQNATHVYVWWPRMKSYMNLLDPNTERLFTSATKSGKVGRQPIGILRKMAEFLELANIAEYSGHSFRRTSATVLSEKGTGLEKLKQHGGWKSASVFVSAMLTLQFVRR